MVADEAYINLNFDRQELEHCYGKNVHILTDPVSLSQLADLCDENTIQPQINNLVRELYQFLIRNVVRREFPIEEVKVKTRMAAVSKFGVERPRARLPLGQPVRREEYENDS